MKPLMKWQYDAGTAWLDGTDNAPKSIRSALRWLNINRGQWNRICDRYDEMHK